MKQFLLLLLFVTTAGVASQVRAQNAGDYRSAGSGDWALAGNWQRFDGAAWQPAPAAPSSADGVITILGTDSISVTVNGTNADQLTVNGILNIATPQFYLNDAAGFDLIVNGMMHVPAGGVINNDQTTFASTIEYKGDVLDGQGGVSVPITFDGENHQYLTGQIYFGAMTLNNPNNLTIVNQNSFASVNFIDGKIIAEGYFVLTQYFNGFTGQSNKRFIDGNVTAILYDNTLQTFSLPIGKGSNYTPIVFKVQQSISVQTDFAITAVAGAPAARTLPASLFSVSPVRYISITRDGESSLLQASLQLDYNAADGVSDASQLRIAKSNGSSWDNIGGKGTAVPSGNITSTVNFTTVGDFVLAKAAVDILPLNGSFSKENVFGTTFLPLTTNADGKINLTLTSHNNNHLHLQLIDKDSVTNFKGVTLNIVGNSSGTYSKDGLAAGTYYVKITPTIVSQPYSYTVADNLVVPAEANNNEPDSTLTFATTLLLNDTAVGHIGYYYGNHRDTADWYKVTTTVDGRLRIAVASANVNPVAVKLFDNNGTTLLAQATASGNSTDSINRDGLAAGTYYVVVVSHHPEQFEPYKLSAKVYTPTEANDAEPNDAPGNSITLASLDKVTGHAGYYYNNHRDTTDWYNVTLSQKGSLKLVLTSGNANSMTLALYKNDGVLLFSKKTNNGHNSDPIVINQPGIAAGTYYITVSSYHEGFFEPYTLVDTVYTPADFTAPAVNANSVNPAALTGKKLTGDIDVMAYPNPATSQLKINITGGIAVNETFNAVLTNASGKNVWATNKIAATALSGLSINVSKLPAGIYFLHFTGANNHVITKKIIVAR